MLWFDEKSIFSVHTICYISVRALFPLQIHSYDGNLTLKITFDSEEPPSEPAEAIIVGNGITLIWKKPSMLQPINEQVSKTSSVKIPNISEHYIGLKCLKSAILFR